MGSQSLKLYYSPNLNPRVSVATARYLNAPVEFVRASPRAPGNVEAFRAINPNALVPVLVEGERRIWETDAIACRLSRLVGSDFWRTGDEEPELLMWVSWAAHHLNNAGGTIYFERLIRPRYLGQPSDEAAVGEAVRAFEEHAKVLDGELQGRTWVLGDRISYADFRVGTCLPFAEAAEMPLTAFPNVRRLGEQLNRLDAWREPFAGLPE